MFNFFKKDQNQDNEYEKQIEQLKKELKEQKDLADRNYRMLRSVNSSSHLSLWMTYFDVKGNPTGIRFTNEMRRTLGYSLNELEDTVESLTAIIHPDDADMVMDAYQKAVIDKRAVYDIAYRLKIKSGEYRLFHAAGECVRRADGTPDFFIGTFTDIQEQIETKEKLEVNQRRQEAVDTMMLEGSWSIDLTRYAIDDPDAPMVFSSQFKNILGCTGSRDFPDIMQSWISRIHPDDLPSASDAMAQQLADPTGTTVFDMEYRMRHSNGEYRWVRASSTVVWSQDKRTPLMAAGTILDISDEKKNQMCFREEMAPKIASLRDGIKSIASTVNSATVQMREMATQQNEMTESAHKIEESVDASMDIIGSIKSIADQTNLLSLNASIEAARAGEAGRGFAVVATEVQNLSSSSKETTGYISEILGDMNSAIKEMLGKIEKISENVSEENEEMEKINSTIEQLHDFANEIGEMVSTLYK